MAARNVDRLGRVDGPTTWDVYKRLDVSLDPAGPESLFDLAGEVLSAGQVEPVAIHVERARAAVLAAGLADRITVHHGVMHDLPYPDASFDLVWCRDVVEQVDDLEGALGEVVRVMKAGSRLIVYTTVVTDLLTAQDAALMSRHLVNVDGNLDRSAVELASHDHARIAQDALPSPAGETHSSPVA